MGKECGSSVSSPFFGGALCDIANGCEGDYPPCRLPRILILSFLLPLLRKSLRSLTYITMGVVIQPRSQGPPSSSLEKVPWLRLVTCLQDLEDPRKINEERGTKVKCLSPLNSFTELSKEWKLLPTSKLSEDARLARRPA